MGIVELKLRKLACLETKGMLEQKQAEIQQAMIQNQMQLIETDILIRSEMERANATPVEREDLPPA